MVTEATREEPLVESDEYVDCDSANDGEDECDDVDAGDEVDDGDYDCGDLFGRRHDEQCVGDVLSERRQYEDDGYDDFFDRQQVEHDGI